MDEKKKKIICISVLATIILVGFIIRMILFSQSPYVSGVDGGFYAYTTQQVLETGTMSEAWYSSNPVLFYVAAFFALMFGVNAGVMIATGLFSVLLGASVYLLMQELFKDNKASLVAAFLVTFAPLALRLMADVRKNVAGLFFMPLILYFIIKSFDNKKYLIGVAVTGLLGILSHQSVIVTGFVLMAYFVLYAVMKRKIEKNEIIVLGILAIPMLIASVFLFSYLLDGLSWVAASSGMFSANYEGLDSYLIPLVIAAIPGALVCIKRQERADIFLLAWIITAFLFTLAAICGDNLWRFTLMSFVPLTLAAGISFSWLYNKTKVVGILALIIICGVVLGQFFYFGLNDWQMQPMLNEDRMHALEASSAMVPENAVVLTYVESHPAFWVRYYYGSDTEVVETSALAETVNEALEQGEEVYIVSLTYQGPEEKSYEGLEQYVEEVYNENGVTLSLVTSSFSEEGNQEQRNTNQKNSHSEYSWERLKYVSTYFILPYEIIYMINPPYVEIFQALIGINASVALIGLLLAGLAWLIKKTSKHTQYIIMCIVVLIIASLYVFHPVVFWGPGNDMMGPPNPDNNQAMGQPHDPQNQQHPPNNGLTGGVVTDNNQHPPQEHNEMGPPNEEGSGGLCPDGVCDAAESADPTMCPQDCS